jgi:hypothetical protein
VEQRALEVWGSEEQLEAERERREEERAKSKVKKYNKQLKGMNWWRCLRMVTVVGVADGSI